MQVGKRRLEKSWEERTWKSVMYHHKKQSVESGLLDIFWSIWKWRAIYYSNAIYLAAENYCIKKK